MSVHGGYVLHLYCCCQQCCTNRTPSGAYIEGVMQEICEPDKAMAFREARKRGWRIRPKADLCWAPGHKRLATDAPRFDSSSRHTTP